MRLHTRLLAAIAASAVTLVLTASPALPMTERDSAGPSVVPPKVTAPVIPGWPASRLERVRKCIVYRESRGNYRARRSDGGTSSGAYGYIDLTWHHFKGYRHAWQAPKSVQDRRFYQSWNTWVRQGSVQHRNPWFHADSMCW